MIRGGLVGPKGAAKAGSRWTTGRQSRTTISTFDQCRMLRGRLRGETSAVQAGREQGKEMTPALTERRVRAGVATLTARELTLYRREKPARETLRARTANRHR